MERKTDLRSGGSTTHTAYHKMFSTSGCIGCICLGELLGLSEHENISLRVLAFSEVITQEGLDTEW